MSDKNESETMSAAKAKALLDAAPAGPYEALHPDDMPGRSVVVGGSERHPPYDAFVVGIDDKPRVALAELFAASPALAATVIAQATEIERLRAELVTARADGASEMREAAARAADERASARGHTQATLFARERPDMAFVVGIKGGEASAVADQIRALPLPEPSSVSGSAVSPLRAVADKAAALVLWHDANTPDGYLNDADGHLWTMIDALRAAGYEMPTGTPTGPSREEMARLRAELVTARSALRNYAPRCGACRLAPATKETDDGRVWRLRCDACAVGATSTDVDHADAIRAATVTP
jgi:hypothetical protein